MVRGKQAFESINWEFIWKAVSHYGLPCKYIRILQAFFHDTISAVGHNEIMVDSPLGLMSDLVLDREIFKGLLYLMCA